MVSVVTEKCIKCKYTDCVEVCPVDCFYEGKNMLAINPDECIDCGLCRMECPINAIVTDDEASEEEIELNTKYSLEWPNITSKKDPMPEADEYKNVENKLEMLDPEPGEGD